MNPPPLRWWRMFGHRIVHVGDCWEFTGNRNNAGYGRVSLDGLKVIASRASWSVATGREIPTGQIVMHTCDNPPCINPAHLRLGTHLLNHRDKVAKGRANCGGESNGFHRLTWIEVREIRRRYAAGERQTDLAREFAVSRPCVRDLLLHITWRNDPAEQQAA